MKLLRKLPEAHRVQYPETLQGLGNTFLLEDILFVEPYCLSYFLAVEIKYLDKSEGGEGTYFGPWGRDKPYFHSS